MEELNHIECLIIDSFENNINEHSFSDEGTTATGDKFTIHSRMEHYKTPGLSLSIVNDEKIWDTIFNKIDSNFGMTWSIIFEK